MKKKFIYALSAMLLLGAPLALAGCNNNNDTPLNPDPKPENPDDKPGDKEQGGDDEGGKDTPETPVNEVASFTVRKATENDLSVGETIAILAEAFNSKNEALSDVQFAFTSSNKAVLDETSVNSGVFAAKSIGEVTIKVRCIDNLDLPAQQVTVKVAKDSPNAVGAFNFVGQSYEEKLEVLGKVEEYAVKHHLTGITLFQNGGYVMYNSRVEKPTNNYITGYGFGILSEGQLTSDLSADQEPNAAWRGYYHSYGGNSNKGKFNYLDDTGSESASLYEYVSSTLYGTKMNAQKDGYEYYPLLAKATPASVTINGTEYKTANPVRPVALNLSEATGLGTKYRIYVRTGKDGLVYNHGSNKKYTFVDKDGNLKSNYSFKNREVDVEDYITPYRVLLNQKIKLNRSADMISDGSDTTLKGAKAYYSATKENSDINKTKDLFDKMVGIKSGYDSAVGSYYLDFELNKPITPFAAMTGLSSSLVSPIPEDFIRAISPAINEATGEPKAGMENDIYELGMKKAYGVSGTDNGTTPVDNLLSIAPYVLTESDKTHIIYEKNDLWYERKSSDPAINSRYKIPGIKLAYFDSSSDPNKVFNTFIEVGALDAASIPQDYIKQYKDDPRTTKTQGDSTFKLNLNTCTQDEWDARFLDANKTTTYNNGLTYRCKPLMSNDSFVDALSYALDRETFASNRGNIPSQSYFAPAYLWDPEEGKSYDETDEHKAVIAAYSPSTFGYSRELATKLFDKAITEEINKGSYTGYTDHETIKIEWMNTSDKKEYGEEIAKYFEDAFSKTEAYAKGFRITWEQGEGDADYQKVYNTMRSGCFDLGFGAISGMTNDPLGFMEVLKADNSTGFTLNYGMDTAKIVTSRTYGTGSNKKTVAVNDGYIVYKGQKWSYDGLWAAAKKGAIVSEDGSIVEKPITIKQSGTGSAYNESKDVYTMRVEIERSEAASVAQFKLFESEELKSSAYVTLTISYTEDEATSVVVYNLPLTSEYIRILGVGDDGFLEEGVDPVIDISIPGTITSDLVEGLSGEIKYSDIQAVSVNVTYYMVINDIPVADSIDVSLQYKNK